MYYWVCSLIAIHIHCWYDDVLIFVYFISSYDRLLVSFDDCGCIANRHIRMMKRKVESGKKKSEWNSFDKQKWETDIRVYYYTKACVRIGTNAIYSIYFLHYPSLIHYITIWIMCGSTNPPLKKKICEKQQNEWMRFVWIDHVKSFIFWTLYLFNCNFEFLIYWHNNKGYFCCLFAHFQHFN